MTDILKMILIIEETACMNLEKYLADRREFINEQIGMLLEREPGHPLSDFFQYVMEGGKRFRPILVMAAAEACGLDGEKVLPAALAVELIHNFSLVHDDLPCMDDDEFRRGRETCHKKFGEWRAVLTGDALLIWALGLLEENAEIQGIDPRSVLQVLKLYSHAAGHAGMTGGQVLDKDAQEKGEIDRETLLKIHRMKTGALIRASVMAGGILAGCPQENLEKLAIYGENVGLTFQIIDDMLDREEDEDPESVSFPAVFGVEESCEMARKATRKAMDSLDVFDEKAQPLRLLAAFLLNRKK